MALEVRDQISQKGATATPLAHRLVVVALSVFTAYCGGETLSTSTQAAPEDAGPDAFLTDAAGDAASQDGDSAMICTPSPPDAQDWKCFLGEVNYDCNLVFHEDPPALEGPCTPEGLECEHWCAAVCHCSQGGWSCILPPCFR